MASPDMDGVCTARARRIHCPCSAHGQTYAQRMHNAACSAHARFRYAECSSNAHLMLAACSANARRGYAVRSSYAQITHAAGSVHACRRYPVCSPYVRCMLVVCSSCAPCVLLVCCSFVSRFGAYLLGIYSIAFLRTCLAVGVPKVVLKPGGHL